MSDFRFKQFRVKNEDSPMKVGTDGVLLGAAIRLTGQERRILDIGTGTGVIALMLAQRCESAVIVGVEIDPDAAREANFNFKRSQWANRLELNACSLNEYDANSVEKRFDLIVSNPPYFDGSLLNPDSRRSIARHTVSLSCRELLDFSKRHLEKEGRLALILPYESRDSLLREAALLGLHTTRIISIFSTSKKDATRIIAEFRAEPCQNPEENKLTIRNDEGYTYEYLNLMHEFYLFA